MPAVYHSCPAPSIYAVGKAFKTAQEALRHAHDGAGRFRVGYSVWEILEGRLRRLATFPPPDCPAAIDRNQRPVRITAAERQDRETVNPNPNPKEIHP